VANGCRDKVWGCCSFSEKKGYGKMTGYICCGKDGVRGGGERKEVRSMPRSQRDEKRLCGKG